MARNVVNQDNILSNNWLENNGKCIKLINV